MFCIRTAPAGADLYRHYGNMPHDASVHKLYRFLTSLFCVRNVGSRRKRTMLFCKSSYPQKTTQESNNQFVGNTSL